jgi:hypothetical protein
LRPTLEFSTALPCRISVHAERDVTKPATIKPGAMVELYAAPGTEGAAREVEATLGGIMAETAHWSSPSGGRSGFFSSEPFLEEGSPHVGFQRHTPPSLCLTRRRGIVLPPLASHLPHSPDESEQEARRRR